MLCLVVSASLFLFTAATLTYYGLEARAIRNSSNNLTVKDNLVWGVEIFESCITFPEARTIKRRMD